MLATVRTLAGMRWNCKVSNIKDFGFKEKNMAMKRKKITILAITFLAIGLMTAGCKPASVETKQMAGTMEELPSPLMKTACLPFTKSQ